MGKNTKCFDSQLQRPLPWAGRPPREGEFDFLRVHHNFRDTFSDLQEVESNKHHTSINLSTKDVAAAILSI